MVTLDSFLCVCELVLLSSVFVGDEIRRVLVEAVIPLVTGVCMRKRAGTRHSGRLDRGELFLAEYDQFDDYLEMVIQFGVRVGVMGTNYEWVWLSPPF